MTHSPAEVLRAALCTGPDAPVAVPVASPAPVWPLYVGTLPDSPDNAACVYDMGGKPDGRVMRTGETVQHPGFQLRVRGTDHTTAFKKIDDMRVLLDSILNFAVAIDGKAYIICSITQQSGILSLGQEPDGKKRNGFTLNGTITLREELP